MIQKEDISQDKLTQSEIVSEKKFIDGAENLPLPSFGMQALPKSSLNGYFAAINPNGYQNSTSQDKLLKSNKNAKKRKNIPDNETNVKKKLMPANPPPIKKQPTISDNSDESQYQEQQKTAAQQAEVNPRITDFFTTNKWLKSKGSAVQQSIETPSISIVLPDTEAQIRENKILLQKLQEIEHSEKYHIQEYNRVSSENRVNLDKSNQFKRKAQEAFASLLIKNEEYLRELNKIQIEKEKFRLGEFIQRRESVRYVEEWMDGYEIRTTKEAYRAIQQQIDDLEKQKKEITIKQQQNGKKNNEKNIDKNQQKLTFALEQHDNSNSQLFTEMNSNSKKDRIYFQLNMQVKEKSDLETKLGRLEEERNLFVLRLKKYTDEINCRYARPGTDNHEKAWPLLSERYQLLSLLGKGGFSEVYKGYDLEEFRLSACKIHHLNSQWPEQAKSNYIKHALRENEIHQHLKHQNIVKSYDTIEINSDTFCTVLEYCDGLDLSHHLKKYKCLLEKEAKIIIRQILSALNYLNQQGTKVIHYDLKPQNILFHKGEVKISDFGLCKIIDSDQTRMELTSQGLGTYWYLPPECFINSETAPSISTKVDVWSVGVIMFEMIYGQRPFGNGMSQEKIMKEQIILKSTQVIFPSAPQIHKNGVSEPCKEFIKRCLTYNMEGRWNVQDAFFSPFIQSVK